MNTVDRGMQFAKKRFIALLQKKLIFYQSFTGIGSGEAFSKQSECLCLISVKKSCVRMQLNETVLDANMKSARSTLFLLIEGIQPHQISILPRKILLKKAKYKNILLDVIAQDG